MYCIALWILGIAGGLVGLVLLAGAIAIWTLDLDRFIAPTRRSRSRPMPTDSATGNSPGECRGKLEDVAIAVAGRLGPYEALHARQWPYPIDVAGDVAGRRGSIVAKPARMATRIRSTELILAYASNSFKGNVSVTPGGRRPKVAIYASTKSIRVADARSPRGAVR